MNLEDGQITLVGVEGTIGGIVHALSHPSLHGALVIGEPGTGKSAIARRLVSVIDAHHQRCFVVRATANLAEVPYGSLGPYLTDATAATLGSSLSALRTLVSYFRHASEGREAVVIVDDAHHLDDDSSHILTQLVISRTIKIVLFSNGMPPRSGDLFSLYTDGFISRVDIGGLTDEDAEMLCEAVLGGPITRGAGHYLARQSGGNPLMLRALLDHSSATGELVERDGVWCLSGRFHPPSPPLRDLARTLLQGLTEQERTIYEIVALSGGLAQSRLARLEEDAGAQQLLRRGLLRTVATSANPLRIAHPMMTRVIRALVPAGRSAELRERVFDDEVILPALHEGRMDYLNWAVDCGVAVPAEVLLEAARTAAHVSWPESALRFSGAARAGGEDHAAAVEEARLRVNLGDYGVAVEMLDQVLSASVRPMAIVDASALKALACVRRGDEPSALHAIADACTARLEAASAERDPAEPPAGTDESAPHAVTLLHLLGWILEGRFGTARTELDSLEAALSSAGDVPDARVPVLMLVYRGATDGALGRSGTALTDLRSALDDVDRSSGELEHLRPHIVAQYVSLLVHAGEFATAVEVLNEYRRLPVVSLEYLSGPLAALEAVLEVRRGRFRTALHILKPALAALRQLDSEMLLPYVLGVAAWAASSLGETVAAKAFEREFSAVSPTGSRPLLLLGRAFIAAASVGTPDSGDLSELQELADTARSANFPSCEKDILELLLVLGDSARAGRLAELGGQLEGSEAQLLTDYARALAEADADALLMAADHAEGVQKMPLAASASLRAMQLFDEQGDGRARRLALGVVRRRQALLERSVAQEEGSLRSSHELTSREREIGKLAADGATNRAIARALVLSTRTVEGHLYRIYGKLGITTREDLAAEFAGEEELH